MLNDLLAKNGSGGDKLYVEDVFSTWLYTGNGSTQTITNGIDLAGKGGMVWLKDRTSANPAWIMDTLRGTSSTLQPSSTNGAGTISTAITAFNANGFAIGANGNSNTNNNNYASWTFRKAPKFFTICTYTGNNTNRAISHDLGSVPGMIIIKATSAAVAWNVYHRSLSNTQYVVLNTTAAATTDATKWNSTTATATEFYLGSDSQVNGTGATYVAYLFAHNAGGFGADGSQNVISCGSFTADGSGNATVNLGYEPQYILWKASSATGNWWMTDNMRGWSMNGYSYLSAESSAAESSLSTPYYIPTATGFVFQNSGISAGVTYIYMAIRRGPMRVPTDATKVFNPYYRAGSAGSTIQIPSTALSYPPDTYLGFVAYSGSTYPRYFVSRLADQWSLQSDSADAEQFGPSNPLVTISGFQGKVRVGAAGVVNSSGTEIVDMYLRRSPSFFDTVYYSGTGTTNQSVTHNLGVQPELIIYKSRTNAVNWIVHTPSLISANKFLWLNSTSAADANSTQGYTNSLAPTATLIRPGLTQLNQSGWNYVAYLFATCPGVSKVGSYTGTGTTLQIDCGFTNGARFVLIKRTDTTGNWCFWNTATGISASSDPFMRINQNAQILTGNDWVDPYSPGFELSSTAGAEVNASGGTYIYLAIA